ncbi:MAG TPA: hypothetical protein VEU78_05070 [Steroidobacteraceae bacterium]|nr:hypothetical protein [Steroidobacteraceae bacterium]
MLVALAAALGIVVADHAALRAAPRATAAELETLWQGDVLEIRGERAGYLKVYDHRRERAGYLAESAARTAGLAEADAPELLAVLRFLSERPGSEALGISYGAAYLRAVPARDLDAEPFVAIARMAERLADRASRSGASHAEVAAHLEVVRQFGIGMRTFDLNGRMQLCYEGELYRRVLAMPAAGAAERAHAALGLTRPDCIDPAMGQVLRAAADEERRSLLERVDERPLTPLLRSRLHARRALVWASVAYGQARRGEPPGVAGQHALDELLAVHPDDLGEDRRAEYLDALLRVAAIRWAAAPPTPPSGPLTLTAASGEPGQTCVTLTNARAPAAPLVRRCTYGIVWTASAQPVAQGSAMVLAVQPLETWRELWVFHPSGAHWAIDVIPPGVEDPEEGYVEFAGFAPGTRRLLVAREVKERGRFRRRFEELRLDDLALVRQASAPELLADFGRWQDLAWRRDTLALH